MKTIRTFIAIPLGEEVAQNAIRLIERLRYPNDGIKWVPTDNLHLTLKFLGEVENTEVPAVCRVVEDIVSTFEPFDLHVAGTGGLPSNQRPRVLISRIDDSTNSLVQIVQNLEDRFADLGFKREPRDYTPHLTLGRTKGGSRRPDAKVMQRLQDERDTEVGFMVVDCVQVMASFLEKRGPSYQVMDTIDLG